VKRGAVIGIVIGTVVVAAGAGIAAWALTRPPAPSDVALTYLRALESGDADAALAQTSADDQAAAQARTAFSDAAARPTEPRLGETREDAVAATVEVTYALDGTDVAATLTLHQKEGGWRISDGLGTVSPTTTLGAAVAIGDLIVPTGGDPVRLLPARYDVVAAPTEVLTGSTTVDVAPGADVPAAVEASLSPDAIATVQAQVDAYAEACAQPATTVPANCGLKVPWGADLSTLTSLDFRIEKTPQVTLSADATSFDATGGVIVATARGTSRTGGNGAFTYRADDWALRGSVSFDGAQLVLAVR